MICQFYFYCHLASSFMIVRIRSRSSFWKICLATVIQYVSLPVRRTTSSICTEKATKEPKIQECQIGRSSLASAEVMREMAWPFQFLALPISVLPTGNSGRETPPVAWWKPDNHNVFQHRSFPCLFPPVSQVPSEFCPPPLGMLQVSR